MSKEQIKVSVYCAAYNHERFIEQTLKGFVSQKTSFPFEAIVHDDASTDETAKVIAEYAEKYPDIIKPIYQTENQYSKKIKIFREFFLPKMQGEYVAFCEGDDYWTDENKLQTQVDFLEAHPECVMVTHNTERITVDGDSLDNIVREADDGYLDLEDIIGQGSQKIPHYSSIMIRSSFARAGKPDFFYLSAGDNAWRMFAFTVGKVYYINKIMSRYRVQTPGSWTVRMLSDSQKQAEYLTRELRFYEEYDVFTDGKYKSLIENITNRKKYAVYMLREEYKEAYKISSKIGFSKIKRIMLWFLTNFKFLQKIYKRRKNGKK